MSVLTFPGRSGRTQGVPAPVFSAYPTQNPPLAGECQKKAVRALLERLGAIHQRTCPCVGIPEVHRCHPLERRVIIALKALDSGVSVDQAVAAAGSFGVLGSVEVRQ